MRLSFLIINVTLQILLPAAIRLKRAWLQIQCVIYHLYGFYVGHNKNKNER